MIKRRWLVYRYENLGSFVHGEWDKLSSCVLCLWADNKQEGHQPALSRKGFQGKTLPVVIATPRWIWPALLPEKCTHTRTHAGARTDGDCNSPPTTNTSDIGSDDSQGPVPWFPTHTTHQTHVEKLEELCSHTVGTLRSMHWWVCPQAVACVVGKSQYRRCGESLKLDRQMLSCRKKVLWITPSFTLFQGSESTSRNESTSMLNKNSVFLFLRHQNHCLITSERKNIWLSTLHAWTVSFLRVHVSFRLVNVKQKVDFLSKSSQYLSPVFEDLCNLPKMAWESSG